MLIGTAIFSWSFALWVEDRSALLTKGPYRIFRHPQYLGIIVLILGVSLRTARPISLISWGTMTYAYVLMAYFEEQGLTKKLGEAYLNYKSNTWFMLPFPDALTPKLDNIRTWVKIVIATIILVAYILAIIFFSFGQVVSLI
jgi:protein-S-isoprenylcysteine O-methyltransferase Ste14